MRHCAETVILAEFCAITSRLSVAEHVHSFLSCCIRQMSDPCYCFDHHHEKEYTEVYGDSRLALFGSLEPSCVSETGRHSWPCNRSRKDCAFHQDHDQQRKSRHEGQTIRVVEFGKCCLVNPSLKAAFK